MYFVISLALLIAGCFKSSSVMLITSALFAIADSLNSRVPESKKPDYYKSDLM